MPDTKRWLMRQAAGLHHRLWWTRAMTLGVRVIVLERERVFLVRHTYIDGWYLPGGGVDPGETAEAAALRELREETGLRCAERLTLHGIFRNRSHSRRDHVVCYVVRRFTTEAKPPDHEIAEGGFFPVDALPEGATPATRARLAELLPGQPISEDW